jgi:hypothetical protein
VHDPERIHTGDKADVLKIPETVIELLWGVSCCSSNSVRVESSQYSGLTPEKDLAKEKTA